MVNCAVYNDTLYGTGFFTQICGGPSNYIAKWDGTTWVSTNIPLTEAGHQLETINNQLFIAAYVGGIDSNWVYYFDGSTLNKWGTGVYLTTASGFSELANIYDVIEFNGQIYACGEFDRVGTQSISGIMRWNGSNWEDVGGGLSGNILGAPPIMYPHQMIIHDNELCVSGNFRYAGGVEVNGIAKWNGSTWSALGSGFNSTVYGVGLYNGELFAGGDFTQSGAQTVKRIAKWNGTNWVSLGFGFEPPSQMSYSFVHTFFEANGGLFIAGGLQEIELDGGGTIPCGGIIHLAGTTISTFNGGVAGNDIEAVGETSDGEILIGGGVLGNGYVGILNDTLVEMYEIQESRFEAYPNPMEEIVTIRCDEQIVHLKLNDVNGREISILLTDELSIDVSHLEKGIYTLWYQTETKFGTIRLVK